MASQKILCNIKRGIAGNWINGCEFESSWRHLLYKGSRANSPVPREKMRKKVDILHKCLSRFHIQ